MALIALRPTERAAVGLALLAADAKLRGRPARDYFDALLPLVHQLGPAGVRYLVDLLLEPSTIHAEGQCPSS